jgi:arylsulfatase A-like enzyme
MRILIFSFSILLAWIFTPQTVLANTDQPNFVIIFIDDMGYGDPSSYGGTMIETPGMDRLAAEGVRATAGYVTSPVCGPSRHGLLSGAYQQRFGIEANTDGFDNMPGIRIPRSHTTMPEAFRLAGYRTAHIGVWNLTTDPRVWFDEVYSHITFGADYFPDDTGHYPGVDRRSRWDRGARDYGFGPVNPGDEYLTDRLGREAVEFIEDNADQPFFLYFASNAVHSPFHAKAEHREAVAHIESEALQVYAAMLLSLDENVGHILDALDRMGIADNTVVFLASDNGPSGPVQDGWPDHWEEDITMGSQGHFSGRKASFRDGGIRIPFLLRWPGKFPAGKVFDEPVTTLDIYPTFAAAASISIPEETTIDGVNLLPYLRDGQPGPVERKLFWSGSDRASGAMRMGDWKLLFSAANAPPSLHHLINDPAEQVDLIAQYPEIWSEMYTAWVRLQNKMPNSFRSRYAAQREAHQQRLVRGPRALHDLDEEDEVPIEDPGLAIYEDFLAEPPDDGQGPALWFGTSSGFNMGHGGAFAIGTGSTFDDNHADFFGNPGGAFGLESHASGGAVIDGTAGTNYGSGDEGSILLTFRTGDDVLTLASIFAKGVFNDDDPMEVNIFQGFLRINYRAGAASKTAVRLIRIVPNSWYTIAISWNTTGATGRLNWSVVDMEDSVHTHGVLSPHIVGETGQPFRVAGRSATLNPFFGSLQNLAIYDRELDRATLDRMLSALVPLDQ